MVRKVFWSVATVIAGVCSAGFLATGASAVDLPPGVTITANMGFAPPEGLGAFQAMTFVIDIAPGAGLPLHSHPGRSEVMVLDGQLTEHKPNGDQKCSNCMHFVPGKTPKAMGECKIIPGDTEIAPEGYCIAWVKKT